MRLRETWLLAMREVADALRSRWFLAAAACFLALALGLAWLGLAGSGRSGLAGFDRTSAGVLNLALFFVPLLALALGGLGLAGELEDGSLGPLLALPVTRAEVYAGKYLGLLAAVTGAILTGFGATGLIVGLSAGGGDLAAFVALVGLSIGVAAATLAIGTMLSALLETRAKVLGAAFPVWLFMVCLCDLGAIGLTVARELGPAAVFFLGTLNPVQQARVLGVLALTERVEVLGPVGLYALDTFGQGGTVMLVVWATALTTCLALGIGYWKFRKIPVM